MEAMNPDTGEVISIAEAAKDIRPPKYWRRVEGIVEGEPGPEYEAAFWEVQKKVGPVVLADTENAFSKSRYTSLPELLAKTMPFITGAGLTQKQGCGRIICYGGVDHPKRVLLLPIWTEVRHKATGQWERVYIEIPLLKVDPQGFGSALTYGRRYALQAFWSMAGTDDDGILASLKPQLDQEAGQDVSAGIIIQIKECKNAEELKAWQERNRSGFEILDEQVIAKLREAYSARLQELKSDSPASSQTAKPAKGPKGH